MPRFFFHARQGGTLIEDPDGTELPDTAAARAEAVAIVRALAAEALRANRPPDRYQIEIADAARRLLAVVTLQVIEAFL